MLIYFLQEYLFKKFKTHTKLLFVIVLLNFR